MSHKIVLILTSNSETLLLCRELSCLKVKMHHGNQESVELRDECNHCTCVAESDLQLSESGSESD